MKYIGINIGALTVKVAALNGAEPAAAVVPHLGRPLAVLDKLLTEKEYAGADYFGVSGHLGHISEAAAIQRALRELGKLISTRWFPSAASRSWFTSLPTAGSPTSCRTTNAPPAAASSSCSRSAGWGWASRKRSDRSFDGKVVPLASRCSVHCKSDITHKLNRNEASSEDILHTLHDSMASKVVALLEKGQRELRRVLLIGGVTRNAAMLAALREKLPATEFVVLPESPWFEAWGSALLTRDEPLYRCPEISAQAEPGPPPAAQPLRRPGPGHSPRRSQQAPPDGPWSWEWMRARRRPRRSCSIPRPGGRRVALHPHARRSRRGDPRMSARAGRSGRQPQCRLGRHHRLGPGTRRRLSRHRACLQRDLGPCRRRDPLRRRCGHDLRDRRPGLQVHLLAQRRAHRLRHEQRLFRRHRLVSRGERPGRSGHRRSRRSPTSRWPLPRPCSSRRPARRSSTPTSASPSKKDNPRENIVAGLVYAIAGQLPQPSQGRALRGQEGLPARRRRPEPRGRPRFRP